jgi:hypothetical protein
VAGLAQKIRDKKLKTQLSREARNAKEAAAEAVKAELLQTDEPG